MRTSATKASRNDVLRFKDAAELGASLEYAGPRNPDAAAVSQGYLKLYLDGRLTDVEATRKAFEQTRQALGTLATLCVDMGKEARSLRAASGVPERVSAPDFITSLRDSDEIEGAAFCDDQLRRAHRDDDYPRPAHAVAIVSKAAFDEARTAADLRSQTAGDELMVLAGDEGLARCAGSGLRRAVVARPVDFAKGGKGLKLIWAAFVLDKHHVQTWTDADHRASVGFRIPLVPA